MSSNKQTAHVVIEKANSRLVGTALQHFQNAVAADADDRIPDVILNLLQSTQYLERVVHTVPHSSYEHRYGADALEKRRFYNIGAGEMWYHPFWTAMDISLISPEAGISYDFNDHTPFPIETNTAKLIYSSHCLEHLNQKILDHVLVESYRALEPGGLNKNSGSRY
jgi:hypothetical protein